MARRCDPQAADEAFWMLEAVMSDFVVANHWSRWPPPGTRHTARDPCLVHFSQGRLYRLTCLGPRTGSPPVKNRVLDPVRVRMLHPSIDNHGSAFHLDRPLKTNRGPKDLSANGTSETSRRDPAKSASKAVMRRTSSEDRS